MMIELLRERRSVRTFTAGPVSAEHRATLEEAALRSPSSRGLDPWHFVWVDDPSLLASLATAKAHGAGLLAGAPLAAVVCADESRSDTWVEDASIASILLQLTAQSLGLGSCWVQFRMRRRADGVDAEEAVRHLLSIPDRLRVLSAIAIGHPAEQPPGHGADHLDRSKLHYNSFGG